MVIKMPYIKETDSGKYQAQVYVKDPLTGKRKRLYKTFDDEDEAEWWALNKKRESEKGNLKYHQNKTVADILREWLEEHKSNIDETTYDGYKLNIESHLIPILGHIKIENFHRENVKSYFKHKRKEGRLDGKEGGLSENSLKKHYIVLKMAMEYAIDNDLVNDNPVIKYPSPKPENKEAQVMSEKEAEQLLTTAKKVSPWMYRFIALDLLTGLRRSEIAALTWENIDLQEKYIIIKQTLKPIKGKGTVLKKKTKNDSSTRIISIPEQAVKILTEHIKAQNKNKELLKDKYDDSVDYVFAKQYGGHFGIRYFNDKFNEILDEAGLPQKYGIHTLRHTFATLCIKYQVSKETLMSLLGHSSYSTTVDYYGHFGLDMKREATDTLSNNIDINI